MLTAAKSHSQRSKTIMKTLSFLILNLFILNTSFAQTENLFKPEVPGWSYSFNTNDALLNHDHESFHGVLTKNTTEFAPSMLVFKLATDTLLEKKVSLKNGLKLNFLKADLLIFAKKKQNL
jgi:hypothetical protein